MCGIILSVLNKTDKTEPGAFLDPRLVFLGRAIGAKKTNTVIFF